MSISRPMSEVLPSLYKSHRILHQRAPRVELLSSRLFSQTTSPRQARRKLSTSTRLTAATSANETERRTPRKARNIHNPDRGPESKEDTQTDFGQMNMLNVAPVPTTSVDVCTHDGFILDSGLRISDGDGVLLMGSEAFVWRPWMSQSQSQLRGGGLVTGDKLKTLKSAGRQDVTRAGTGGIINVKGQFEVAPEAWGLLNAMWPRPDILIVGTGPSIRPLAPQTRLALQELGMRIEVLDTRNAASQFNLLATERGLQEIAAALVPIGFGEK